MALELAKKGYTVLACDLNMKGLLKLSQISKKLGLAENLFLFACTAEKLPVKIKTADVVIANAILEHLPKEKEAIREIDRVSKQKSYGFITIPLKLKYLWPFLWPVNIIHDKRIGHLRRYDKKSLLKKFGPYNFKIKKVFYTGHLVKVIGVLIQSVTRIHGLDGLLEDIDQFGENKAYGASNIIVVLSRS